MKNRKLKAMKKSNAFYKLKDHIPDFSSPKTMKTGENAPLERQVDILS